MTQLDLWDGFTGEPNPPKPIDPALVPEKTGEYLRPLLGIQFTDKQLAIATHDLTPQLVIAGAGSGKTSVMAARVVHAVAFQGIDASRVLGLTFTNKAAAELSSRVRKSLGKLANAGILVVDDDPDLVGADDQPTVSTYHSYAATIVRDHALRIGREPGATLLNEAARWQLALRVVRQARGPFTALDVLPATVAQRVLSLAGEIAEHLADIDDVRALDAQLIADAAVLPKVIAVTKSAVAAARAREELLTLVEAYSAAKQRINRIDFGDQVALAAQIAEQSEAVRRLERGRFGLVVLDEYQDTGVAQRRLLSSLYADGHPVVAVGDPNQAIYGWRGASVGNLLRFGSHFERADGGEVQAQPLMTSFRCGGRVLDAANRIAATIGAHAPERRASISVEQLTATSDRVDAGEVVLARLLTDAEESAWVADQLATQVADGRAPGQIAVLARRKSDFPRLHRALVDRDLPVEVVGLGGLLRMPEVADVVAMLALLADPTANPAAVRVLTGPRFRIGVRDLAALGRRAGRLARWTPDKDVEAGTDDSDIGPSGLAAAIVKATASVDTVDVPSLLDAIDSPGNHEKYSVEALERLANLRIELRGLRRLLGQPLIELVTEVVRTIGLDVEIEAESEQVASARSANLAAFLDHVGGFVGLSGESDLPALLAYLQAADEAEDGFDAGGVSAADTIKLMTVHKAKGLEWDVVCVPSMQSTVFPGKNRLPWTGKAEVLPSPLRGDYVDLPQYRSPDSVDLRQLAEETKADSRDEERRLAYVAFTRPRELLLASTHCWAATRKTHCSPSEFLNDLRELEGSSVRVDVWVEDSGEDDPHPLASDQIDDIVWPAPEPPSVARRRTAAAEVLAAIERRQAAPTAAAADVTLGRDLEVALSWSEQVGLITAELRRESTPIRDVLLPRTLSASQVVELAADPAELARSIGRPLPARPAPQARRGSRFHAWVENLSGVSPLIDPADLPGATDADVDDADLLELQEKFRASGWADRRPVAVEQAFELVAGGRLLRGRIDAVYAGEDTGSKASYDVIDYKTGSVPRDFAAASLQLSIYRLAWADLMKVEPAQVDAGFLYVRTGDLKRPARLLNLAELSAVLMGS